ncbi:MAG TPA: response regulator transcription factor [Ktedonobacteraceae bacterium]|nr:response regulator transcription factor [Ktedonobacteraceae bacterium]
MTRVFVLAPTPMMQAGLHTMLTGAGMQVTGESAIPADMIAELPAIDVIVVDELLLAETGRVLTNTSTAETAPITLVVLTSDVEHSVALLRSLPLRGWSMVSVDATASQLQAAVVASAEGFVVLPTAYSHQLYNQRPAPPAIPSSTAINLSPLDEGLTAREREVLELVSQGLSNKLIARRLSISEHTVKFHISSITSKLGAASRTDAVSKGVRLGLITL